MPDATQSPDDLFEHHRPALLIWAEVQAPAWIRAKTEPADLVQQTLLEALRDRGKLEGMGEHDVLAFLRRALTNNLIDAARKYSRNKTDVSAEAAEASSVRLADWIAANHSSPSERAARNERFARLAAGLGRLPDDQRIAVEMRYLQSAKVGEIAKLLDRSENAVSALLHRAVLALRNDRHILES